MGFSFGIGADLLAQQAPGGWANTIDKAARTPQSSVILLVLALTIVRVVLYFVTRDVPIHKRYAGYRSAVFVNECCDAIVYAGIFVFLIIRPYFVQAFRIPSGSMVSTLLVNDFIVANKLIYRYTDPQRGDIVVFRPPVTAILDPSEIDPDGQVNVDYVKRCIGTPGDVIEVKNDVVYRNGSPLKEPYKHYTEPLDEPQDTLFRELTPEERADMPRYDYKLALIDGKYIPVTMNGSMINSDNGHTAKQFQVTGEMIDRLRNAPPAAIPPGYYLMLGDNRNFSYDGRAWGLVPRADIVGRAEWIWWPLKRFGSIKSN